MEKDIRFTEKKVDESWKSTASSPSKESSKEEVSEPAPAQEGKINFQSYLNSLGFQCLMCLGEIPPPGSEKPETNWEAAKEIIELLLLIKDKTRGNLSAKEEKMLTHLIADLQLRFARLNTPSES